MARRSRCQRLCGATIGAQQGWAGRSCLPALLACMLLGLRLKELFFMCSFLNQRVTSTQCFEVRLCKEGFTRLGILPYCGEDVEGIVLEAVSEDLNTAVGSYNASARRDERICPSQSIERVNGLVDWEAMMQEMSSAQVLKILFNRRLTKTQHKALADMKTRREKCNTLLGYFDDAQIEEEQCPICLQNMEGTSSSILRSPCGHCFHGECIAKWLIKRGKRCPLCNFEYGGPMARDASQDPVRRVTV